MINELNKPKDKKTFQGLTITYKANKDNTAWIVNVESKKLND